jgi:hypothetical protein
MSNREGREAYRTYFVIRSQRHAKRVRLTTIKACDFQSSQAGINRRVVEKLGMRTRRSDEASITWNTAEAHRSYLVLWEIEPGRATPSQVSIVFDDKIFELRIHKCSQIVLRIDQAPRLGQCCFKSIHCAKPGKGGLAFSRSNMILDCFDWSSSNRASLVARSWQRFVFSTRIWSLVVSRNQASG